MVGDETGVRTMQLLWFDFSGAKFSGLGGWGGGQLDPPGRLEETLQRGPHKMVLGAIVQ